jgi:protein TonB
MPAPRAAEVSAPGDGRLSAVFVLAIWVSCLAIGLIGWWVRYPRPAAPKVEMETVVVQRLEVELTPDLAPPQLTPATVIDSAPPPPPDAVVQPNLPAPVAVAAPSPSIAFAIPVEGPVTIVEPSRAAYVAPPAETQAAPVAAPQPQTLTYGTGEGRQPAPEYPRRAIREGQEGSVLVRFIVGADGRVVSVEAHEPSPWPLLNESAVRVIRERWRFSGGKLRAYEVAIRFQLKK